MKLSRLIGGLFLAVAALLSDVSAQDSVNDDLTKLNLEQLMKVQFTTASKHAEEASATPASVTIITRSQIQAFGYRTLADVLQGVRGYWVNSDHNYSYLGMRGFARPGDYNTRILLLVDGHRLNDNIFHQALIGTEFPLDIELIDHIEILRGSASSIYGTNAFLGVVNVVTRTPSISPTVETSVSVGSELARKVRFTLGLPHVLDGALVSASFYRANGDENIYFPEFDSPATNHGVAHRVDGDRFSSGFAHLRRGSWSFEALLGSREKLIPTGSFDAEFNDGGNRTIDTRGFGEARYHRSFLSGLELTTRWFYDAYAYRGTYVYVENGSREISLDTARGDWVGHETTISGPLGTRNLVTTGFEVRYNIRQNQANRWESGGVPILDSRERSTVFAFYVQDELKVTKRFSINAGLRMDRYRTFPTAVSPRAAAIFRPDERTVLKYAYGRAFRAPNSYELYYQDGTTQDSNPSLHPETIDSQNVSIERALSPNWKVVGEAFYSRLNGLLDLEVDPTSGLSRYMNLSSATGKGLEFEVAAQHGRWDGELSYTFQKSRGSGAPLANLPQHTVKLKLQAPVYKTVKAAAELQYLGTQSTYLGSLIRPTMRTNLTLSTRTPIRGFEVSASCFNLFNRKNYDPTLPGLRQLRLAEQGREFHIRISWAHSSR